MYRQCAHARSHADLAACGAVFGFVHTTEASAAQFLLQVKRFFRPCWQCTESVRVDTMMILASHMRTLTHAQTHTLTHMHTCSIG